MIKKKGLLLVISGPSGAGKGTVCKELLKRNPDFKLSVSATTRAPREGEVDGESYYFLTKEKFNEKFSKEFILFTKEEFLASNLLGYGVPHPKIDDFLGDYIAIAISDSAINIKTALSKERNVKLSNHCGLTENEMEVPLIVFDMK